MREMRLSWSYGRGKNSVGGKQICFDWGSIESMIRRIGRDSGVVSLDILDRTDVGPIELQVRSDRNAFLITLGEENDREYFVRTFTNPNGSNEVIEILGDRWSTNQVCFDLDVVLNVFNEFFCTGNVTNDILAE